MHVTIYGNTLERVCNTCMCYTHFIIYLGLCTINNIYRFTKLFFLFSVLREFKELLRKQATVEAFTEWLDIVVEQKVIKVMIAPVRLLHFACGTLSICYCASLGYPIYVVLSAADSSFFIMCICMLVFIYKSMYMHVYVCAHMKSNAEGIVLMTAMILRSPISTIQ
jgi:hypothetical protein